jgi:hypothetical protein
MARDGMSRELYAEMLGYLGLPAGIAIAASLSGDELPMDGHATGDPFGPRPRVPSSAVQC